MSSSESKGEKANPYASRDPVGSAFSPCQNPPEVYQDIDIRSLVTFGSSRSIFPFLYAHVCAPIYYLSQTQKVVCKYLDIFQENDRTALVEQYREASNELSRAKVLLADIESQANNLKQELQIKSSDIQRLTERIDYLERDLHQVRKKKMNFKYNS